MNRDMERRLYELLRLQDAMWKRVSELVRRQAKLFIRKAT